MSTLQSIYSQSRSIMRLFIINQTQSAISIGNQKPDEIPTLTVSNDNESSAEDGVGFGLYQFTIKRQRKPESIIDSVHSGGLWVYVGFPALQGAFLDEYRTISKTNARLLHSCTYLNNENSTLIGGILYYHVSTSIA